MKDRIGCEELISRFWDFGLAQLKAEWGTEVVMWWQKYEYGFGFMA